MGHGIQEEEDWLLTWLDNIPDLIVRLLGEPGIDLGSRHGGVTELNLMEGGRREAAGKGLLEANTNLKSLLDPEGTGLEKLRVRLGRTKSLIE